MSLWFIKGAMSGRFFCGVDAFYVPQWSKDVAGMKVFASYDDAERYAIDYLRGWYWDVEQAITVPSEAEKVQFLVRAA